MSEVTDRDRERAAAIYRLGRETAGHNREETVEVIAGLLLHERERARAPFLAIAEDYDSLLKPPGLDAKLVADRIRRAAQDQP